MKIEHLTNLSNSQKQVLREKEEQNEKLIGKVEELLNSLSEKSNENSKLVFEISNLRKKVIFFKPFLLISSQISIILFPFS
jgi:hypothetical protein